MPFDTVKGGVAPCWMWWCWLHTDYAPLLRVTFRQFAWLSWQTSTATVLSTVCVRQSPRKACLACTKVASVVVWLTVTSCNALGCVTGTLSPLMGVGLCVSIQFGVLEGTKRLMMVRACVVSHKHESCHSAFPCSFLMRHHGTLLPPPHRQTASRVCDAHITVVDHHNHQWHDSSPAIAQPFCLPVHRG